MYYKINIHGKAFITEAPSMAYATYFFIEEKGHKSLENENPEKSFLYVEAVSPTENPTVNGIPYKLALEAEKIIIKEKWERHIQEHGNKDYRHKWYARLEEIYPLLEIDEED